MGVSVAPRLKSARDIENLLETIGVLSMGFFESFSKGNVERIRLVDSYLRLTGGRVLPLYASDNVD